MNKQAKQYYNQAFEYFKKNEIEKSVQWYKKALALEPKFLEAYVNLAAAYQKGLDNKNAKLYYQKALNLNPKLPLIYFNLAALYGDTNPEKTIQLYQKVLELDPKDWDTLNRLGQTFKRLGDLNKAIDCFKKATFLNPDFENGLFNLGVALSLKGIVLNDKTLLEEAFKPFQKVIRLNPSQAESFSNIGLLYYYLDDDNKAKSYYQKSLGLNNKLVQIYNNLAILYEKKENLLKACFYYKKALEIDPIFPEALGNYCFILKQLCLWDEYTKMTKALDKETQEAIREEQKPSETAFFNVVRSPNPKLNSQLARVWSKYWVARYKSTNPPIFNNYTHQGKKLKIGYLSDGFREFPTTHNILGVLRNHNRNKFKVFIYSYGKDDKSIYRKKIIALADKFRDLKDLSLPDMVKQIYQDQIDIVIDLKGHTRGSKFELLYSRPAPIQISWLGFVGTTQADFIDYFIADKTVLPKANTKYFSEKIIYLPNTYWPTDSSLKPSAVSYQRKDFGIPENSFVFSSFNQPYKIEPEVFDVWMRILKKVPNSVLWQWTSNPQAQKNILKEAEKRGVKKQSIIFAKGVLKPEHLKRLKLADLTLDTNICNGHTTTIDSLYAGVPVITILGNHFASRVSASMLKAIGLPQLTTHSLKEYEELAIELAKNPKKLQTITYKLQTNIKSKPLFDTKTYTKNLEKAYRMTWEAYQKKSKKKNIYVTR